MSDDHSGTSIRAIVVLTGRVQNVGFRDTVVDIAARHHVAGSVRNLRSGDALEIDVEGTRAAVEAFLADVIAHPPRFARIDSVERGTAEPRGAIGFERARMG